ncbi:MAG: hypothetical protein LBF33_03505 [Oscillospiraceae bacterium]|nr:hypothetical protein [Oscillospiraceae bacterium]
MIKLYFKKVKFLFGLVFALLTFTSTCNIPKFVWAEGGNGGSSNTVNVLYTFDEDYARNFGIISIRSAVKSKNPDSIYRFHVVMPKNTSDETKQRIRATVEAGINCSAVIRLVDENFCKELECGDNFRAVSYWRLFPSRYFLQFEMREIPTLIYIDGDTLVLKDLTQLSSAINPRRVFSKPNGAEKRNVIAGVGDLLRETLDAYHSPKELFGISKQNLNDYINSGVIVFSLSDYAEQGIEKKIWSYFFDKGARGKAHDQAAINYACHGLIANLAPEFNSLAFLFFENKNSRYSMYDAREWEKAKTQPTILHFAGNSKPDSDGRRHHPNPFIGLWWDYALESGCRSESDPVYREHYARKRN